jgi:glyoxylase-like metal-dependent hydrolase (beta-lactamase superfamily II)
MEVFDGLHGFLWQSQTANNCNTYLVDGKRRVLIDPGHRALFDHVEKGLHDVGLGVGDIDVVICTHGHPDHLEAVELLRETGATFGLHRQEWRWLSDAGRQMAAAMGMDIDDFEPDFFIGEGDLCIGNLEFSVYHTPGHSPGSICLYWPDKGALFSGDVLFDQGLGRTDLPGGDGAALKTSIKNLAGLQTTWLLPGHGGLIEGAAEVDRNFEQVENFYFAYI